MFLVFIKLQFLRKNGVSEKIEAHSPSTLQHYNNCSAPSFLFVFKKLLAPPPFKRGGRDYAFYTRDYKGEKIKLPFYMKEFLY